MNYKILCVIISLLVLNVLIIMSKMYKVLLSLEDRDGVTRPVFLEAMHKSQKPTDWRIVHGIGWVLGVIVLILEIIVIFDALQCLLFPLKAYLQSSCILSSFCFASVLPLYELQMSLCMPWLTTESVQCPTAASPFATPWNSFPPFTSSFVPPYGTLSNMPMMNPTAGPPMSPAFFPPSSGGGYPLFCSDLGRFQPNTFMQHLNPNSVPNGAFNFPMPQRPPSPLRPTSLFSDNSNCQMSPGTTVIIEEQQ